MPEVKVVQMGQAEYHIPVHNGVAAEAGKDAVGATVTIDTGLGAHETYDARTGRLLDISQSEE